MLREYKAIVTREGKWWMVSVPELDALTQARRISEVELMARELIATMIDAELSDITVRAFIEPIGGKVTVSDRVGAINRYRNEAKHAEELALKTSKELAKELATEGVPVRDIGEILGVSFQRAHQLVNS